jgi:uncharacterized membrane protein
MGLVLSTGGWLASCCASIGCSCLFSCLKSIFPTGYTAAKVYALIFFFLSIVVAATLLTTHPNINLSYWEYSCDSDRCQGIQAVYRIAFTDFFFYLAIAIFSKATVAAHTKFWGLKIFFWIGLCTGMFFVDNDVFSGWANFARIASIVWILIQTVALIELSFVWHSWMMNKAAEEEGMGFYKASYLGLSFLSFVGAIITNALLYKYYAEDCRLNQFTVTITLMFGLFNIFCSISKKINQGVLTPCLVFLYLSYQNWDAILSSPSLECNPYQYNGTSSNVINVISMILLATSLAYTGFSTYNTISKVVPPSVTDVSESEGEHIQNDTKPEDYSTMNSDTEAEITGESTNKKRLSPTEADGAKINDVDVEMSAGNEIESKMIWLFHFCLCLASCYFAMAITNWGTFGGSTDEETMQVSKTSMWVKICSQWVAILYYQLVLWAPVLRGDGEED